MEAGFSRSPTQVHSLNDLLPQSLTCRMLAAGGLHSSHSVAGGPSLENCSIYLGVANYHYVHTYSVYIDSSINAHYLLNTIFCSKFNG